MVDVSNYGAAPQEPVIGVGRQFIALVLSDDEIEGAFNGLCFRRGAKEFLRAPDFGGIEAEMLMRRRFRATGT